MIWKFLKQKVLFPKGSNWVQHWFSRIGLLVHFWSVLLLKEQMMTSVRKTLKRLVWSAQNRLISSEICLESNHKIGRFLPNSFQWSLPRKLPRNSRIGRFFREFVPKNPVKFDFFFRDLSEALSFAAIFVLSHDTYNLDDHVISRVTTPWSFYMTHHYT